MDTNFDSGKFNDVWRRVMPEEKDKEKNLGSNEVEILAGFIDDEFSDSRYYKALASKCGNKNIAAIFCRLSREEYIHMRRLQTEYFLLTGDIKKTEPACISVSSIPEALRTRYMGETEGAEAYKKAALYAGNDRRSRLYSELAEDETRHAGEIFKLIEQLIK
jgi:rubrerythrin